MLTYLKKNIVLFIILIVSSSLFSASMLYSQDGVSTISYNRIKGGQVKVFTGPDSNAIYLRLRSGKPELSALPASSRAEENKHLVKMYGFASRLSPGNPMLPYKIYQLALPPDADPGSLSIELIRKKETQLPSEYKLAPCPPHNICQDQDGVKEELTQTEKWGVGKVIVQGKNTLVYNQNSYFPNKHYVVNYSGQLRKWKIASVMYSPLRYNPVKGNLVLASEVDIKIKFRRIPGYLNNPENIKMLKDNSFEETLKGNILNFQKAKNWYTKPLLKPLPEPAPALPFPDPDYAIIATEDIFHASNGCQSLDDFCFHKENLGFEVMVVTEHQVRSVDGNADTGYTFAVLAGLGGYEDVTGAPAPGARPDKIRKWLQDNYMALGIKYVLLLGNPDPDNAELGDAVGNLPMKNVQLHVDADVPTDYYFAELSAGNWDLDGDGLAGEYYESTGYTTGIPAGVTNKNSFSTRWEGRLEVDTPAVSTTLDGDIAAGVSSISVADATGITWHQVIRIGSPGDADQELIRVNSVVGDQINLFSATVNAHSTGDNVSVDAGVAKVKVKAEGNTVVYLDLDNDGIDSGDIIHEDITNHLQYPEYYSFTLEEGNYPIRVDYRQLADDAYCNVQIVRYGDDVEIDFKHDDGTGTWVEGLTGNFYNSTNFTGAATVQTSSQYSTYLVYEGGGDKGPGGVEFLPELIVGRIPCYDEDGSGLIDYEKMSLILNKIIAYELAVISDNLWRRKVLTVCPYVVDNPTHPDDPTNATHEYNAAKYKWSEMLRDDVASPPLWEWHRIYMEDYGLTPDPETIPCSNTATVNAWDDGQGVVMWMSHGSQTRASDVITNSGLSSLDDTKPSIVFMGACSNGAPEFFAPSAIPLGYQNLKQGAIATVSASRTSYG